MIKNVIKMNVNIGDRSYSFECSPDSPLGEVHDAVTQIKDYIIGRIQEANKERTENVDSQ